MESLLSTVTNTLFSREFVFFIDALWVILVSLVIYKQHNSIQEQKEIVDADNKLLMAIKQRLLLHLQKEIQSVKYQEYVKKVLTDAVDTIDKVSKNRQKNTKELELLDKKVTNNLFAIDSRLNDIENPVPKTSDQKRVNPTKKRRKKKLVVVKKTSKKKVTKKKAKKKTSKKTTKKK